MDNIIPIALTTKEGIERTFYKTAKQVYEMLAGMLTRSATPPLVKQDYVAWVRDTLKNGAMRDTLFRTWLADYQSPALDKALAKLSVGDTGIISELNRFCVSGTPGALVEGMLMNIHKSLRAPVPGSEQDNMLVGVALSGAMVGILPSWVSPEIIAHSAVIGTMAMGIADIEIKWQEGVRDIDTFACYIWAVATFFQDNFMIRRALATWPELIDGFDRDSEFETWFAKPSTQSESVIPLLIAIGSVTACSAVISSRINAVCNATKPNLQIKAIPEIMAALDRMIRDMPALINSSWAARRARVAGDILDTLSDTIECIDSVLPHDPASSSIRRYMLEVETVLRRSDAQDRRLEIFFQFIMEWAKSLYAQIHVLTIAARSTAKINKSTQEMATDIMGNRVQLSAAMEKLNTAVTFEEESRQQLIELVESIREIGDPVVLLDPEEDPVDDSSTDGGVPTQEMGIPSAETPVDSDAVHLFTSELNSVRDQCAAQKEKLKVAGAKIQQLQSELSATQAVSGQIMASTQSIIERAPTSTPTLMRPREALVAAAVARPALRILPSAWESAERSREFKYGDRLFEMLLKLGNEYITAISAGVPDSQIRSIFGASGYKANESDTTRSSNDCVRERTFIVDGTPVFMEKHLGIGVSPDKRETIRVHFEVIDGQVVIGHCGTHLIATKKV